MQGPAFVEAAPWFRPPSPRPSPSGRGRTTIPVCSSPNDNRRMNRRDLLRASVVGSCGAGLWSLLGEASRRDPFRSAVPPAFSVIPVVGDGRWIWKEPPEGETGYLEPRSYDVSVGIEMEGTGSATDIISTTAA